MGKCSSIRVEKLREELRNVKPSISFVRALAYTDVYKKTEAKPPIIRRAMATSEALDRMPIYLEEGQLFIGSNTSRLNGREFSENVSTNWMYRAGGPKSLKDRSFEQIECTDEDQRVFDEIIGPYWIDRTIMSRLYASVPEYLTERTIGSGFVEASYFAGLQSSHSNMDYDFIITNGLNGFRKKCKEMIEEWNIENDAMSKKHLYEACLLELDAIERYALRCSEFAAKLASEETNPNRKAELERMSEICKHSPMEPPRSFQEAIQTTWFAICVMNLEGGSSPSINRFDQYMYPLYKRDIEDGVLTKEEAKEMLECYWIKLSTYGTPSDDTSASFISGNAKFMNMQVGGTDKKGNDATNELSYLILDALIATATVQPHMTVRIHPGSPEKFRMKILDLVQEGTGHPSIYNDIVAKEILLQQGATIAEANDYGAGGCMEVGVRGGYYWAPGVWVNIGMAVDMVFTQGKKRENVAGKCQGVQLSVKTPDPRIFKTYEEFEDAVKQHIICQFESTHQLQTQVAELYRDYPVVWQSMTTNDCLDRGLDFHHGGVHSSCVPGLDPMGIPDVADSLATVKKLVFDDKVITMDELCEALDHDFQGYENIRELCLAVPKYGNDDDYVDGLAQGICNWMCDYARSMEGILAKYDPDKETAKLRHHVGIAFAPISGSVSFGTYVGALPSGRKSGEPLGDSCSPYMGADVNGPTAALKSVAKIGHNKTHGSITNMYLTKDLLYKNESRKAINNMVQTYFDNGGAHIQFSCNSRETLLDAQKNPENYKHLLVRVAGYSAYFVDLLKPVQDSILMRNIYDEI